MCLAQGHSAVPPVRLEPATPKSQVKHSTTEPPRSLHKNHLAKNGSSENTKHTFKLMDITLRKLAGSI